MEEEEEEAAAAEESAGAKRKAPSGGGAGGSGAKAARSGEAGPSAAAQEAATIAVVCRARAPTGRENPEPVQLIQRLIPAKHTLGATQDDAQRPEPPISMILTMDAGGWWSTLTRAPLPAPADGDGAGAAPPPVPEWKQGFDVAPPAEGSEGAPRPSFTLLNERPKAYVCANGAVELYGHDRQHLTIIQGAMQGSSPGRETRDMWTPIREELRGASRLEVFPRDPNLSVATCMGALIVKNSQLKGKQEIRVSDRMKDSAEVRRHAAAAAAPPPPPPPPLPPPRRRRRAAPALPPHTDAPPARPPAASQERVPLVAFCDRRESEEELIVVAGEVNLKTFLIPKEAWHQQQSEEELEATMPADVRAAGELTRKEWKKQTKKERQKHWVESSNEDRKGTTLISSIANNTAAHRLGDVRHMLVSDTRDGWEKHATYRNGVILLGGDGGVALWSVHKLGEIDVPGTKSKARRDDLHDVTAVCKIQRGELCHWLVGRDRGALLLLEAKTLASLRAFTLELPSPLPSAAASVVSALAVPTGGPISEDDFHGAEESSRRSCSAPASATGASTATTPTTSKCLRADTLRWLVRAGGGAREAGDR